mmetsp:Transcript_17969/g.28120  ORF Transcript_17969/g.28120 Transcript_17969/m.28120 type:complete len:167 (-) Transcript_17969:57-557(-)|eukprot:CAMPEP_0201521434 /NCGR_PEP_ID=MMETSP0161_2-20130828/14419_1 /ASSEMBLY_ACC=CAM_ASM_000251 /TAXON_ID=180227 /ORGANISM="Neoparamoeba aestuarina, Strain SoJaBio B1-5/56/2" /LENGTH=166 /DNA_ID=CAMNT_0047920071 /DNA_START=30 /DNA_END=530 /DNA_ORIENTATION=-
MGKVRTKTIKRAARQIVERFYSQLTKDFYLNKRFINEFGTIPTQRLRNKIAGYTTHLMKRISMGPVRGISLKLQEEEREKKMDYVPEISVVDQAVQNGIEVDETTLAMISKLSCGVPSTVKCKSLGNLTTAIPVNINAGQNRNQNRSRGAGQRRGPREGARQRVQA